MITADYEAIAAEAMAYHPWQIQSELAWLLAFAHGTVVEIGSRNGGTLWAWAKVADRVICVDLEEPRSDAGEPALHGATFVQGDSHDSRTVEKVAELLGGEKANLLFIDGDHSYEGVKADWMLYGPLAKVVAFHDINQDKVPEEVIEVPEFWATLRDRRIVERIDDNPKGWAGIGVISGEEANRGPS